jgi:hypothetical protein
LIKNHWISELKEMGKRIEEKTPDTNLIGPTERKTANLV